MMDSWNGFHVVSKATFQFQLPRIPNNCPKRGWDEMDGDQIHWICRLFVSLSIMISSRVLFSLSSSLDNISFDFLLTCPAGLWKLVNPSTTKSLCGSGSSQPFRQQREPPPPPPLCTDQECSHSEVNGNSEKILKPLTQWMKGTDIQKSDTRLTKSLPRPLIDLIVIGSGPAGMAVWMPINVARTGKDRNLVTECSHAVRKVEEHW